VGFSQTLYKEVRLASSNKRCFQSILSSLVKPLVDHDHRNSEILQFPYFSRLSSLDGMMEKTDPI